MDRSATPARRARRRGRPPVFSGHETRRREDADRLARANRPAALRQARMHPGVVGPRREREIDADRGRRPEAPQSIAEIARPPRWDGPRAGRRRTPSMIVFISTAWGARDLLRAELVSAPEQGTVPATPQQAKAARSTVRAAAQRGADG
jgi:hypothetical protein